MIQVKQKNPGFCQDFQAAVREGFEPSVPFPVRQFSKLVLSASQAPHRFHMMFVACKYSNSGICCK